jgi:enoyl-CoA hydratase
VPGQALTVAKDLAGRLAAGAPFALAAGKWLVSRGAALELDAAIGYERETVSMLFGTADAAEGFAAFRGRRPASFSGQ